MINILGSYNITLIGDGSSTTVTIPMKFLATPSMFAQGQMPKAIVDVMQGTTSIPFTYDPVAFLLTLTFSGPPAAGNIPIQIDAEFGKAN